MPHTGLFVRKERLSLELGHLLLKSNANEVALQLEPLPRDSQESSPTPQFKSMISSALSFIYCPTFISIHDHWKNHSFDWTFVGKVMSLLFNMLSRLVIIFLPKSKYLFISWLQSPSAVILEPPKIKSDTVSTVSPSIP